MRICMPVENNEGLESVIFGHFGSAPGFMIYDTETKELNSVLNKNEHHEHGSCNPLMSFADIKLDFLVVAGIGGGALMKLNQAGIRVFQAAGRTIQENLDVLDRQGLPEFTMQHTCQGHGHSGGCAH
ncbi:NifB/NifX family molybdenum-iron cluster-binding protein [bacterium]|nr:NifB/NifX family molybdenum-iron cluster-binding protein [bacterium]